MEILELEFKKLKKNILLLMLLLLSFVYLFYDIQNKEREYFENKDIELTNIYNAMGENLFNKINMENKELESEIRDLSELYNSVQAVLELKYSGELVEQAKEEFNFYLILSEYQEKYGQEYLNKTEVEKRKTIFQKLSNNHLAEIANESGKEGIYFLKFVLDNWYSYMGLLFLILFLFDTWSSDLEKKHINLVKIQPISLRKYYNNKFFFIFFAYLVIFLCYIICQIKLDKSV